MGVREAVVLHKLNWEHEYPLSFGTAYKYRVYERFSSAVWKLSRRLLQTHQPLMRM